MPASEITVTLPAVGADQRYVDGWVAAATAAGQTPEAFVLEFLRAQGKSYAHNYKVGTFPSSDFILRVQPAEYAGIVAAAETDPNVAALLAELRNEPFAAVDDPRLGPGLDYLVAVGLLTAERRTELLSYERPEPVVPET